MPLSKSTNLKHLAQVPFKSMPMSREELLASHVEDFRYGCACGKRHVWSVKRGRLIVDGEDVTDAC